MTGGKGILIRRLHGTSLDNLPAHTPNRRRTGACSRPRKGDGYTRRPLGVACVIGSILLRGSMNIQSLLDSVPIPTATDMDNRRQLGRRYTLVFLRNGSASRDDGPHDEQLHLEHLQHL